MSITITNFNWTRLTIVYHKIIYHAYLVKFHLLLNYAFLRIEHSEDVSSRSSPKTSRTVKYIICDNPSWVREKTLLDQQHMLREIASLVASRIILNSLLWVAQRTLNSLIRRIRCNITIRQFNHQLLSISHIPNSYAQWQLNTEPI